MASAGVHASNCPPTYALATGGGYRKKTLAKQFPRELYLRGDLPCHTLLCDQPACRALATRDGPTKAGGPDQVHAVGVLAPDASHYVIPSMASLLRFWEIFLRSPTPLLLLRTHLLNAACTKQLERRMGELLADGASSRRVAFFENEHHMATATRQREDESIDQRHARAERRAAKFYAQHLQESKTIVLIEEQPAPTELQDESVTPAHGYPRTSGGVVIHSMSSYLAWLQAQSPSSTAASPLADRDDELEPAALLRLYESLLEAERTKLRAKLAQAQAAQELEAMLASLKLNWTRHTSEGGTALADEDASSTAILSAPSIEMEYEEHLPVDLARQAVERGMLLQGHLHVNKYHASLDASLDLGGRLVDAQTGVLVDSSSAASSSGQLGSIFISGMVDRNRAVDGDQVVVQLLPRSMWKAPRTHLVAGRSTGENDEQDDSDDPSKHVPTGRVVAVIERQRRPYVCTLQLENAGGEFSLVVPMNPAMPKMRMRTHQVHALANQRLLVQLDAWDAASKYPSGVYIRSLGPIGDRETGVRCILQELQIAHPPFSINMLNSLPYRPEQPDAKLAKFKVGSGYHSRGELTPFSWNLPAEALVGRRDLRQTHCNAVCSIDPIGCEDIDDALSCKLLPNGRVEIGVHIADVTFFLPERSLLDQEASRRGTSVYLVDRRLDMLPSTLSADLCSLRGGCDRLCVSTMWELDVETGKVENTWIGRTAIHNSFALSYEEAQLMVDTAGGTKRPPPLPAGHPDAKLTLEQRYSTALTSSLTKEEQAVLYPQVSMLLNLARILRQKRIQAGALELYSLSPKFVLSDDKTEVKDVEDEADLEVHSTIAEWMVFANSVVAYTIYKAFPSSALLRHHPYPTPARFEQLREMAKSLGVELDTSSNKALAASIDKAEQIVKEREFATQTKEATKLLGKAQPALDQGASKTWVVQLLKELAARAMREAQYFSTGSVEHVRDFYHYGLSADYYTHFTSPIRRYADIIVHRQLLGVVEAEAREKARLKKETKLIKQGELDVSAVPFAVVATAAAAPSTSYTNANLQTLATNLNVKNRNAKIASMESQDLMLACFLAGPPPSPSSDLPPPPPRVERCEGLIVSLRDNGFIVLLPRYHVKGALVLCDRQGRANLAHPLDAAFPHADSEEQEARGQPKARVERNEREQTLTLTLGSALSAPSGAPADLAAPLPLSHTFRVFEPCVVDISLRPNLSRYRTPKPIFKLVWHSGAATTPLTSQVRGDSSSTAAARSSSSGQDVSPFSSGPAAPDGARKVKQSAPSSSASSLYALLRAAAAAPPPKPRHQKAEEKEQTVRVDHKLQRSAARVRVRHSGALGGRLLFTPSGVLPPELLKANILEARGRNDEHQAQDDEDY